MQRKPHQAGVHWSLTYAQTIPNVFKESKNVKLS